MNMKGTDIRITYAILTNNNGRYIVYAPHLNIVGFGKSAEEAEYDLEIAIHDFFSFHHKENQLKQKLISLGYTFFDHTSKEPEKWSMPVHFLKNAELMSTGHKHKQFAMN